ncbi:MAG: hypothetical protein Q8M20_18190 [Rhodocyclaceae bacterium]|nr:hypothetical protein [Rhodocyclaceae bacterium]
MAITPITVVNHNLTDRELVNAVDNFMAELPTFAEELNAAAMAMNNNSTNSTSASALTIAVGALSLTVQTAKSYLVGMSVKVALTADATNWMYGDVTAYDPITGALAVYVASIQGSGSGSAWTVSQSSPGGASINGSATQDFVVRSLKQQLGGTIASAATINLDVTTGDTIDVSGVATVSAVILTAGNIKIIRHTGGQILVNSSAMILPGGGNITTQFGDFSVWLGGAAPDTAFCIAYNRAGGYDDIGIIVADSMPGTRAGYIDCPPAVSLSLDPALYPVLFARIGYTWSGGATSGNFSPPWVPVDYAVVAGGTVGSSTTGDVKTHTHSGVVGGSSYQWQGVGATPQAPNGSTAIGYTGSTANYPAAQRVKFRVRYK